MSALTERKEERHDTQPVAVLPVRGSVNHKFQTIAAGGREEDDMATGEEEEEKKDRTGRGVGLHSIARRR